MAKTQKSAKQADMLKDAYVDGLTGGNRLTPSAAQDPTVVGPSQQQLLASEHIMLDSGHRGFINDGDGTSYIHKDGRQLSAPAPDMANPVEGGAGEKYLRQLDQNEYQEFDNIYRRWEDQNIYGTGNLAQGGR